MGNRVGTLLKKNKNKNKNKVEYSNLNKILLHNPVDEIQKYDIFTDDAMSPENGQPSNSENDPEIPTFDCDFCVRPVCLQDSFNIKGCAHFYCRQCVVKFVVSKLQQNLMSITCPVPDCRGILEAEYCRPILPKAVFDWWGKSMCENVVIGAGNGGYFYCPFRDCSALLIHDVHGDFKQSMCPHCKRVLCAKCKVPWHSEFDCAKFQKLRAKKEDKMVKELAKKKKWRRCPSCKFYVEKTHGCCYVKCRCGHAFCYKCGARSSSSSHVCPRCRH